MISDSVPWKDDLLRIADRLEKRTSQRRWTERTSFLVERDVMVGAYAVRKLLEAHKLSDELRTETVPARRHALVGPAPDLWGRWELWEFYDFEHGTEQELSLPVFTNQIIHSWAWMISVTDAKVPLFDGIYVSSDYERKRSLFYLSAATIASTFRAVGNDEIATTRWVRNTHGERIITVSNGIRSGS